MAVVSADEFIDGLTRSGLMSAEEVHAFQVSLPPTAGAASVKMLAAELVRRGRLTKYQAGRIATGRSLGLVLGKYVIQDKIGEGGMGEVFVAEHRRMKRPVVVKVLPESHVHSEDSIRRFQREVEAAAQLQHPNIVTAFDADEERGIHFLVMEYVDGVALGDLVSEKGALAVDLAVYCMLQASHGLDYAHSKGIIHRDIKPNNLLLDKDGVVKILDMGLARFDDGSVTAEHEEELTKQNQIIGTVEYMSPEQVDNSSLVDPRSDIYSLGCTFFRLLTGRPPYQGDTPVKTLLAHRTEPVPSARAMRPEVSSDVEKILQRMLAKLPANRYQTMIELSADLKVCLEALEGETPLTAPASAPVIKSTEPDTKAFEPPGTVKMNRRSESKTTSARRSEATAVTPKQSEPAVGIDLGTTYSAVAYLDDARRPLVISNAEGDKTTPSVVLLDDGDVIVGKEAGKAMATDMDSIAECAKRDLGHRFFRKAIDGEQLPPEVIEAWILNKLRADAQNVIGPFTKAVITVPAYFDEVRRKATQQAGMIAGIDVLDIINEPTAAALTFGFQHGRLSLDDDDADAKRVLVYDLGGGTFDVTIMEIGAGEFVTLATDGDVQLGGRDWDQRLVDYVAEQFIRAHGFDPREDPNTLGRLLRECEDAKRTLSARSKSSVACDYHGRAERFEITRQRFEEITLDLLERTSFTTRQTLRSTGLEWDDIDHVLMVGGSTRMPGVAAMLQQLSGKPPEATLSPDEAIAQGAAIHAGFVLDRLDGRRPRVRVRNVNSHSLGIAGTDPKTKRKQTAVLIPRNTPLPAKAKRVFKTLKDGQRTIVAGIVEGESRDPAECMEIGKCTVRNLPEDLPAGTPVEIRFQYQENGLLRIRVNVGGVKDKVTYEITRAHNLTESELEQWQQRVTK